MKSMRNKCRQPQRLTAWVLALAVLFASAFHHTHAAPGGKHESVSNKQHPALTVKKFFSTEKAAKEGMLQLCGKERREDAEAYEKARIVKIEAYFRGALREGTGFLVSNSTVVTAGHNIFSFERGAFADKVIVKFKGKTYSVKEMFTVKGFITNESDECDYGAISMDRPVTGSSQMPYGDDFQTGRVRVAGFPKPEIDSAGQNVALRNVSGKLLADSGAVKERKSEMMWVESVQTSTGQSGSPVLRSKSVAIAIHTGGRCDGDNPIEKSVRIDGPVKDNIDHWITKQNQKEGEQ